MKTRRQLRSVLRRLLAPAHLPMRVTLAFLLVSSLWLLFSPDGGWLLAFGVTALSAVLLYLLVRREMSAAGDAVQEKEQLLRQLTEHIDEVFWLADATTGQIRYVSPAYEKIWERPRSAIIGAAAIWQDTLHPDDRGSVLGTAGQPAPAPQDYRYRIIRGDSAVRWIQEHTFPVYDEAGTIRRIAGIAQDITTRVSDPEFLDLLVDERTRRFRTLLDGSQRIASVAPALQLDLLPGMILEQLAAIVEFTSASIYTVENGYLRPLASRGTEQAPEPLQTSRLSHQPALSALAADEKPLVIPDLQAETTLVRVVRDAFGQGVREAGAWIGVPLITPSAIGLLVADHLQTGYFTPERTELIVAFASQAAGALESARLFERTQQRVAEAEGLQRVTLALVQKHSLEELLAIICREAWRLIGASGSFILLKEDEQQLRLAYRDERLSGLAERIPIATTHTGRAIRQGQPVVVDGEEAYRAGTTHADPAIKTLLVMPLRVDEEVIGALDVINKPGGFTDDDVRTIGHFADAAALAIERARLQRQREQLAVMRERQRLARELHDSVTQALYSLTLHTKAAQMALSADDLDSAVDSIQEMRDVAREAILGMRRLIFELRPPALEAEGLANALRMRLASVEARAGLATAITVSDDLELPFPVEEELYWIVSEALNNIIKHARAESVTVTLERAGDAVQLSVEDDGIGFDPEPATPSGGIGLRTMAERAERINGRLRVTSPPGGGTRVVVQIDLAETRGEQ